MAKIPKEWQQYFWEVKPEKVDLKKNAWYVIGRVLEYGDLDAVRKVRRYYGDARLKEFLLSTSSRVLSNRTMRFWQVVLKLNSKEGAQIASVRSKNPTWNY